MRTRTRLLVAAGCGAAVFGMVGPLSALPSGTENYNKSFDTVTQCTGVNAGRSITVHAPQKLWPPNHKYYTDIYVTANGKSGDMISLTTTGSHNQFTSGVEDNGAGHTVNDITVRDADSPSTSGDGSPGQPLTATETNGTTQADGDAQTVYTGWEARAERSGTDSTPREYTLTAKAMFNNMPCTSNSPDSSVTFSVPHDMSPKNR